MSDTPIVEGSAAALAALRDAITAALAAHDRAEADAAAARAEQEREQAAARMQNFAEQAANEAYRLGICRGVEVEAAALNEALGAAGLPNMIRCTSSVAKRPDTELQEGLVAIARFPGAIDVRVVARGGRWTLDGKPIDVSAAELEPLPGVRVDAPAGRDADAERAHSAALLDARGGMLHAHIEWPHRLGEGVPTIKGNFYTPTFISKSDVRTHCTHSGYVRRGWRA